MGTGRFTRLVVAVAIGFSLAAVLLTGLALAHAAFVRSEPSPGAALKQPPQQITIRFSQELAKGSYIQVFDQAERRVDSDNTEISFTDPKSMAVGLHPLSPSVYRVEWESISLEDGDAETGSFTFSVTAGSRGVNPVLVVTPIIAVLAIAVALFVFRRARRARS